MLMQPIHYIFWLKGILDTNPDGISARQFDLVKNVTDAMFDHGHKPKSAIEPLPKQHLADLLKGTGIDVFAGYPVPSNQYTGSPDSTMNGEKMRC